MDKPGNDQICAWYSRLSRTALRLTGNPDDAADMTHQAFCRALNRWSQFDGKASPLTWLHSILINCVRDRARRRQLSTTEVVDAWDMIAAPEGTEDGLANIMHREQLAHLREAVRNLPGTIRPAFVSTVLDGYSYEEASELLDVPVGTVASRVYHARRQLIAAMRERFDEE